MKPARRSPARLLRLAAGCLFFAGCAVDQQAEVALYRSVLDAKVPAPAAYDAARELSLRAAMALANRNNEQLAEGGENYVQALIQKRRSAAAFAPRVTMAPNYTVAERPTGALALPSGFRATGSTVRRFEAPVSGDINLLRGGGDVAELSAAEATVTQRRELLVDLQATVLLDVVQAYYGVLRAERAAEVLRSSLALQEEHVLDVQRQLRHGLATTLALAQVQAQRDDTRADLVQAEGDARAGRCALALLLGVAAVDGALVGGFTVPAARSQLADGEQEALARREDLRASGAAVVAARQRVDVAIAQYYPSLSLDVTGFLYREDFADASRWSSLLLLNLPLFTGGRIEADVREAWSFWRQALLEQSAVQRRVRRDVQIAHSDLDTADRRITELRSEVDTAGAALRLARIAFANSLATNLDVLTAADRSLSARLELAAAEFDQAVSYLDLVRATGGIQDFAAGG